MNCTLYFVPDAVTQTMCLLGVIIIIVTFLSNLTMALYFRQIKRKPGGMVFYKSIICISMFAALVGQPLEMANALMKTSQLILNLLSNFCLFFLFCAMYHCIAGLTFERYIAIKREGSKKELERKLLTVFIVFLIIVMCIPKFYNLYNIILKRHYCQQPPDSWMTIIAMCTWLAYCSLSIYILTKKAIKFVKDYDVIRKQKLGKTQATNIKRLNVTKRMWLVFSILWFPYGSVNILQSFLAPDIYELLNAIARGFTSASFTVLPAVYYFMDKNYAEYMQKKTRKHIRCLGNKNKVQNCNNHRLTKLSETTKDVSVTCTPTIK